MKAAIYKKYGRPEVVQLVETAIPIPADNEV
jgi:NADPH:quinone reductase-like Zn-dependent oxidoreductase